MLRLSRSQQGLALVAFCCVWFAAMNLFIKGLGGRVSSSQICFLRSVLAIPLILGIMRGKSLPVASRGWPVLIMRGCTGAFAMLTFFWSIGHIPLAPAVLLNYTAPLFTAVIAFAFMGERLTTAAWVWIALAFAGVVAVLKPSFAGSPWPYLVALSAGFFSGLSYATVKKLTREEAPWRIILYFNFTTTLITLPLLITRWTWPSPRDWALLAGVSASATVGQIWMTEGFERSPISKGTSVMLLNVMLTALGGWWFFGEAPSRGTLFGMAAIAAGILGLTLAD